MPMSDKEEPDLTKQVETGIKRRLSRHGAGEDLRPSQLDPQQAEEVAEQVKSWGSDIRQNRGLLGELTGREGSLPCISWGNNTPYLGPDRLPLEHLLVTFGVSLLSREGAIRINHKPGRGDRILAIGSAMSNLDVARAHGNATDDNLRPRIESPLTGDPYIWEFAAFSHCEEAKTYLTKTPIGEFRWALTKVDGSGTVVMHPDIYREGDIISKAERRNLGFLKNGATTLTVIKSHDGTSVILICGGHPGDTLAVLQIFASERIIKELLHYSAKMHCFEAVIYFTKTIPDHTKRIMRVPDNEIVVGDLVPVTPDERLLSCFTVGSPKRSRTLRSKALFHRSLLAWGVPPELWPHEYKHSSPKARL
jgi:hypothetical protein